MRTKGLVSDRRKGGHRNHRQLAAEGEALRDAASDADAGERTGPGAERYAIELAQRPAGLGKRGIDHRQQAFRMRLTRALIAQGARVVAVERDERAIAALAEIAERYPGRLEVIAGDALAFDPRPHLTAPARVVANLPYNIATALLVQWLTAEPWPPWYDRLVLMFQREVALRITAAPGSKAYGRLSVLAGWRSMARMLFDIAPSAFVPPPKVTSSLVELVPRPEPLACASRTLQRVTEAAFGQRRKMLRQRLKSLGVDPIDLLGKAGIAPTARAEDIPVEGFVALARAFEP